MTPSQNSLESLVESLRAAGEPTRLRLLNVLARGELTVSELTQILCQSQPRVSRHLKLLLEAKLIERLPEGSWVFYRLAEEGAADDRRAFIDRLVSSLPSDDPQIAHDFERLAAVKRGRATQAAEYFAAHAQEWSRIRSLHLAEAEVERMMRELLQSEPAELLVDLGTGTGRVLEALNGLYQRGIGFDVSHAMLSVARVNLERAKLTHAHVRHGDLASLNLPKACADAVVLHQVLHYLDDPAGAVHAAARLVKAGGRLLIVDFAPHKLEFLRQAHAHRRLGFAEDEVSRWCRGAGLEVMAIRHLPPKESPGAPSDHEALTVSLWLARRPLHEARRSALELVS
jgi:ArsR family transcriptional regulator